MIGWYTLDVTPQTSPRPRMGRFGAYMPAKYKAYQDCLMYEMRKHNIPQLDYSEIEVVAYFPYPKSAPKKNLIEGAKYLKTPDTDNVIKAIMDCLQKLDILENDSRISDGIGRKRYTTSKSGRIEFKLSL